MHSKLIVFTLLILIVAACSNRKSNNRYTSTGASTFETLSGKKQTTPLLREDVFALASISTDKSYGYTPANPILVGGNAEQAGVLNQRRFLNALLGPQCHPYGIQ